MLADAYAKLGKGSEALEFIRRALDRPSQVGVIYTNAVIDALAGHKADALRNLKDALKQGYPWRQAQADPDLKSLRDDPEYRTLAAAFASKGN